MSAYLSIFWMYLKNGPISVPQRKKCSPVLREPLVGLLWDLFRFGTEQGRCRKSHAEYDVRANMIKMWANAPGPVGSSHPREERTSRKKVSGQGRVPGVIKINFLAFFTVFLCFLCIWSILGIFLTGILWQAFQAGKTCLQRMLII